MQNLERVTTRKVTPGDLLDMAVAKYIVAVIMAPMPDEYQTKEIAGNVLSSLNSGRTEAHWILGVNGKRVGVICFSVGPYSEAEKDVLVLYVNGIALSPNAPASAWTTLMDDGRLVAAMKGCKYIIFDVAPNGELTQGIITAALAARAQVRFTLEV